MRIGIALLLLIALPLAPVAQEAQPRVQQPPPDPGFQVTVDVVGVTPIHGTGLPRYMVPANVQVFTAEQISSATGDVSGMLGDRAASVNISDVQGGTFQSDLLFRGFAGSPLLGASEGLAVYQDGVRVNEAFGDTINWDALPTAAIASVNLTPGSSPMFGLNALGGALSIRTKDGFSFPGRRASLTTGSFGRHQVQAEAGGHGAALGYFVAGSIVHEDGWRDFSPSTIRRVFGDIAWRGTASALNVSLTAASNDMTGNGTAPIQLLIDDRDAVFTHPDRTGNDLALVTVRAQRQASANTAFDAVAYYRHSRLGTFNGDAADDAEEEGEAGQAFDGVNNISRTRGNAVGITAQMTATAPLLGRGNHFIAGAGLDAAGNRFDFEAEWATLTADRGTIGSGLLDGDAAVNLHTRTATGSAFATNAWSPMDRLTVTASARFNWTSVRLRDQIGTALTGDHRFRRLNPAAGVAYQVHPGVNIYGAYTQSSRVPTPVELTCADPEDPCRLPNAFVSDPPLEQIVAGTWEAGARGRAARTTWSVSAFSTAATDDIIFVSSGTLRGEGHFENVERTRRSGVEASVEYTAPNRLSAYAAYTLLRATYGTDLRIASPFHPLAGDAEILVTKGSRLPGIPAHTAKFGLTAFVTEGLRLGASARTQSGHYFRGDEANLLPRVPGFLVVNAEGRQRITNRIAAVAHMQNVFGADYHTFGVLGDAGLLGEAFEDEPRFYSPGAPRAGWVGVEVRF